MNIARMILTCAVLCGCAAVQADGLGKYQRPFGFELNRSNLGHVKSEYGDTEEFEIPEAHHEFGICYRSEDEDWIVVFLSGREFGGPDKTLLGVAVHAANSLNFPCAPSELAGSDFRIGDLRLLIDEAEFVSMFEGNPQRSDFGHLFYHFDIRRPLTKVEQEHFAQRFGQDHGITGADTSLGVWSLISDGRVVEFGVWQEETY